MKNVTINKKQKLYIINFEKGYTCLGFDVAFNKLTKLHNELSSISFKFNKDHSLEQIVKNHNKTSNEKLKNLAPLPKYKGTMKVYKQLMELTETARILNKEYGITFKSELTKELIGLEGKRVEVVNSSGEKERFNVGKSTGFLPCHLQLKNSRSVSGCIVVGSPFKSVRVL